MASSWQRRTDGFLLGVVVPFGSDAEIEVPKLQLREVVVSEGGTVLWKDGAAQSLAPGIRAVRETPAALVVDCGGGHYRFELKGK